MKIEYEIFQRDQFDDVRETFAGMLRKQGKVTGDPASKAARCRLICIARVDGEAVAIGAVKIKTASDFTDEKAGVPALANEFEWELGYLYTEPELSGRGIGSAVARMLVDAHGKGNLMASTEISVNPAMVAILEKLGFRQFGKPWKSAIHENDLALFLKFR